MTSPEQTQSLTDKQAREVAKTQRTPYRPYDEAEINTYRAGDPVPFPNVGIYRPKGWTLVDRLFVDTSGMGAPDEPGMNLTQLKEFLIKNLEKDYGYAIITKGQFQLYLGVFVQAKKRSNTNSRTHKETK